MYYCLCILVLYKYVFIEPRASLVFNAKVIKDKEGQISKFVALSKCQSCLQTTVFTANTRR